MEYSIIQLKRALKRTEAISIAENWESNPSEIHKFLSEFFSYPKLTQCKGMWVVGIIHEKNAGSLIPFHSAIFDIFKMTNETAVRREIFQILLTTTQEKIRAFMMDAAIQCIQNPKSSVAECHHALQWLLQPSKNHLEICNETIYALSSTLHNRSSAWARYAQKQITRLEKLHSVKAHFK